MDNYNFKREDEFNFISRSGRLIHDGREIKYLKDNER